ncbi:MAG: hypothetical protein Q9163_003256 [Psora crenata]
MVARAKEALVGIMAAESKLFAQVHFHIIAGGAIQQDAVDKISKALVEGGAEAATQSPSQDQHKIPLDAVTHIITDTIDFPDYNTAANSLKAIVRPEWVTSSITKGRLANPRQYSPDPRMFFSGLVVCCADLPMGDADAIIGGVLAMGGLYSSAVTKQVTHIVALTTKSDKCQAALAKNLKCKIVLPHWFDHCLKLGKRIDEAPYCLPDPEILRKSREDRIPEVTRSDLQGASSVQPGRLATPSTSPSSGRRELTVFKGKTLMLSDDIEIGSHLRGVIEDLIVSGGGCLTGSVHKADFFICHYRESREYRIASRAGKDVGNLSWLYHLITTNSWTSPMRRLLHYPISKSGLPGFKHFRISLSNYNGEARIYLENLAKAAGSAFTKTMKEDNTHLITAHQVSEKCDAAKEWNIHMINHLWLEESYAKWQVQSVSNPRYTQFPARTNLGEVVGQTPIDKQALEKYFFPSGSDVGEGVGDDSVSRPMAVKDHNIAPDKASRPSSRPTSSALGREVPIRSIPSDGSTPKASRVNRRHTDGNALQTPANSRFATSGKENETPSTTGSRSAKDKAVAKLHDLAPDIALFEKERKRIGGVTHGGRKNSEDLAQNGNRKRSMSTDGNTETGVDDDVKVTKRAKKGKSLPPPTIRLALSGYKRWVGQQGKKESEERARLREMGILVVQDYINCTHLASPRIVRTEKFICALAHAPMIISTDYVDDCLAENRRLDPVQYPLQDTEYEKRLGYRMTDAIERAKLNQGQLLRKHSIYCTEGVHGGFDTYKAITEVNGGKCMLYRGRPASNPALRAAREEDPSDSESGQTEYMYLLSGTSPDEAKLWPKFRSMAEAMGKTPLVVRTDWLLNLAISQQIIWTDTYTLTEDDIDGDP